MNHGRAIARNIPEGWAFSAWKAADGWAMRRYDWPQPDGRPPRGSLLFQTGRGDMPEKYLEALAHWHAQGWAISGFDWRGQGGSGRLLADPQIGHIDDFSHWTDDLSDFVSAWQPAAPGPVVMMGHSMGGHLLLRALLQQQVKPDAMVLSAPMLGFDLPLPVSWVAALVRRAARLWPTAKAWSGNEKPGTLASRQSLLTHDTQRYADELWWRDQKPELVLGPPSLNWLSQAYDSCLAIEALAGQVEVMTPLLILATRGDGLVSPAAIERVAARLPHTRLHLYGKDVAHELLREVDAVRGDALARVDAFLDEVAPAR